MNKSEIAIIGNPNSGKTTIFNALTGSNQTIGNWPGVTVDKLLGESNIGDKIYKVVDLPGIYSLTSFSEDERIARDYILSNNSELIIDVIDSSNFERNMFLALNLIEMNAPLLLVFNKQDILKKKNINLDIKSLESMIGVPCIGTSAKNKNDINSLKSKITEVTSLNNKSDLEITYPNEIESIISNWEDKLESEKNKRWTALKLLENDKNTFQQITNKNLINSETIKTNIDFIENKLNETPDIVIAEYKYKFIQSLSEKFINKQNSKPGLSDKIDKVVLNKFLGIPIFLLIMYGIFWIVMNIGGSFIDFFDIFFGSIFVDGLGSVLNSINAPTWLITILADGVGAGIQTVATFIPIMFFMFLLLTILEDSGYMARAAFVMDRFMRIIGLPGKAFVPLIVGFGCTVPAIFATRTLENKRDRYLTVFMAPFMSCGARLPVYALFGAAFFSTNSGNIVFALYIIGIVMAILTGLLLKKTLFKGEASHFVMELPNYNTPDIKSLSKHTWLKLKGFTYRAGKVIVIAVAILSILGSFGIDGSFGNNDSENSILAEIGKFITPVFEPMGIQKENWPATVGIFTGLFAKEAVVGTLNSLYVQLDEEEEDNFNFLNSIQESFTTIPENLSGIFGGFSDPLGTTLLNEDSSTIADEIGADKSIYKKLRSNFQNQKNRAFAYLLFILLYFPCLAALGAIIQEIGPKYGWLSIIYLTVLAWIIATLYFQITIMHSLIWIIIPIIMLILIGFIFYYLGKYKKEY